MGIKIVTKRVIFITLVLLLLFLGAYSYSLSKVELRKVNIDNLQNVNQSGFTIGGTVELHNGGIIPVRVNNITYNIILENLSNESAKGNIRGAILRPGRTEKFLFLHRINWAPTTEVALELITPDKAYTKVQGTVYVTDFLFVDIKIPFEERINLEEHIKQFAKKDTEETIIKTGSAITNTTNTLVETISGALEQNTSII
jgi:LEA14-like dessication related protein